MNNDQVQIQQQLEEVGRLAGQAQSSFSSLAQSSSIPREVETALRERLGITTINATLTSLAASIAAINSVAVGTIVPYSAGSPPTGYVTCDGSSYLRAGTYAALFGIIGTTYGTVDGTHFNVPDLRAQVPVGYKAGDANFGTLGGTAGAATVVLLEANLPTNTTTLDAVIGGGLSGSGNPSYGTGRATATAHPNIQPSLTILYMIKI